MVGGSTGRLCSRLNRLNRWLRWLRLERVPCREFSATQTRSKARTKQSADSLCDADTAQHAHAKDCYGADARAKQAADGRQQTKLLCTERFFSRRVTASCGACLRS